MLELDGASLTYEEFRRLCLLPNRPAVIRKACQTNGSVSFDVAQLMRRLQPQSLCHILGAQAAVPVYPMCATAHLPGTVEEVEAAAAVNPLKDEEVAKAALEESANVCVEGEEDGCCMEVPLKTVLQSWLRRSPHKHNNPHETPSRVYYLKDWHLQEALEVATATAATSLTDFNACRQRRVHGDHLYRVPDFLGADWMDRFCQYMQHQPSPPLTPLRKDQPSDEACASEVEKKRNDDGYLGLEGFARAGFGNNRSDYRFCYMGPVGSWTPLHCDVFGTYSWSFNVCGDKLWFFPTVDGNAYLHEHLLPFFPTPPDMRVLTGFAFEGVVQHPGDLVFVPALFYHQVHNITGEVFHWSGEENIREPAEQSNAATCRPTAAAFEVSQREASIGPLTLALNHNWCNAFSVACMTAAFLRDAQRLVASLSVEDLAIVCDSQDPGVWRHHLDAMLQRGTNWSYASMLCFLHFCATQLAEEASAAGMVVDEAERHEALALVRRLLERVTTSYETLFVP